MSGPPTSAKDVPEEPVLRFLLAASPHWCNWYPSAESERSVLHAMPQGTPEKVALAKMRALIRRGLVDGCPCGCRGDFVITDAGRAHLNKGKGAKRPGAVACPAP